MKVESPGATPDGPLGCRRRPAFLYLSERSSVPTIRKRGAGFQVPQHVGSNQGSHDFKGVGVVSTLLSVDHLSFRDRSGDMELL